MKKAIWSSAALLSLTAALSQVLFASADASDADSQPPPAAADELLAQLMQEGETPVRNVCAQCHGPEGQGMVGPPLRQNVENVRGVVRAIVLGSANMPPIGATYSDRQIAAIVTYVRNSWGNKYGVVTEAQAAEYRP